MEHKEQKFIDVTIDKSHIITIGERLYAESIEFIREIVNNAYDADASLVDINVTDDTIEIRDNGSGMDRDGITQYFTIGSRRKLHSPRSPVYGRDRIGQFGIGKFATLSACRRFVVITKSNDFAARVVFDKADWEGSHDSWKLPLEIIPADSRKTNGTTVVLEGLNKSFNPIDIEAKIIEGTPLKAPNFRVRLNGHTITPRSLSGHRMSFLEGTAFGPVSGDIVILPESASQKKNLGIEIRVKQVTVTRELFGMETWGRAMARVAGEVNADFLPVTSDRTGFITDSPEYEAFHDAMLRVMSSVKTALQRMAGKKEGRRVSRALKEALQKIYRALSSNPELSPFGALPVGEGSDGLGGAAAMSEEKKPGEETVKPLHDDTDKDDSDSPPRQVQKKPRVRQLTPNAVMKSMKFGQTGVSCCVDSYGEDSPEVFSEDTVIYINRDHPLYKKESKKMDTHILNLARLITQEIALMKDPRDPRQAFERQSRLLRDAFIEK